CMHVRRIIAARRSRVKRSAGGERRDLLALAGIERGARVGSRAEQGASPVDIAGGKADGTVVEAHSRVIGSESTSGADLLSRLGLAAQAVQGPGEQVVAGGIRPRLDRGPGAPEERVVRPAVIDLEPKHLPVERRRLDVAQLLDE